MRIIIVTLITVFISKIFAFHFYLEGLQKTCFLQDLEEGILLVGRYTVDNVSIQKGENQKDPGVKIKERGMSQFGYKTGQFMFTPDQTIEYKICFEMHIEHPEHYRIRLTFDFLLNNIEIFNDKSIQVIDDMAQKTRDLNQQIYEIRLAQKMMREREIEFRKQSEITNTRVMRWAFIQLLVLISISIWQTVHLQGFFIKQKLV
ncbi:hypothetical protein PCANB_002526 [Pneumocystis canis]|nr:hypothetical protein PCANB_002526 [Pneumocystis canis]